LPSHYSAKSVAADSLADCSLAAGRFGQFGRDRHRDATRPRCEVVNGAVRAADIKHIAHMIAYPMEKTMLIAIIAMCDIFA